MERHVVAKRTQVAIKRSRDVSSGIPRKAETSRRREPPPPRKRCRCCLSDNDILMETNLAEIAAKYPPNTANRGKRASVHKS